MLDLAGILAAVSAVSEGRAPTDTPKAAPELAVSVVSGVSARTSKDVAEAATPDHQDVDPSPETLARSSISNRYNRYNRYTSNDAGSGVSATKAATDTTDTERRARVWRVTLTDGTRFAAVRPEGATHAEMLESVRDQFGAARVATVEVQG